MDNRNTLSVVLKKFEQLLELKYSGSTPKNYLHHVKLFLEFFHMYSKAERYLDRQSLNYLLSEVEVRRGIVYKVSKFLDSPPENKRQFQLVALKIFN